MEAGGLKVELKKPQEAADMDFYSYDLVCVGSPSIEWQPAKPMADLLKAKLNLYRSQGKIKPCAPKVAGKNALVFCTYSGPHTGIDEATPAGKTMRQYFEHFGFNIVGEWYVHRRVSWQRRHEHIRQAWRHQGKTYAGRFGEN